MFIEDGLGTKRCLILGLGDVLRGDEGLGCYVLEALAGEPWSAPVFLAYAGNDARPAAGLIHGAQLVMVVGTFDLGGAAGRIHPWTFARFRSHLKWMADECPRVRLLASTLARAEMAGGIPEDICFPWIQPRLIEGYGLSREARRAMWKTVGRIKRRLFETGFLPQEALSVFPLLRVEPGDCHPSWSRRGEYESG